MEGMASRRWKREERIGIGREKKEQRWRYIGEENERGKRGNAELKYIQNVTGK